MQRQRLAPAYLLAVAAGAAVLAALCMAVLDAPFARWLAAYDTHARWWNLGIAWLEYLFLLEPWKWGTVALLVAGVLVTMLVPRYRAHAVPWLYVGSTHLLARNLTFWLKTLTGRLRPSEWHGGATFFHPDAYSFPSGHVVLFASIVVPVAILYPRVRVPCLAVAVFAAVARVAVGAHFLSDVIGAFALVALVTWLCGAVVARVAWSPTPRASRR